MYAIIDIETTGGNPNKDKITEIAVVLHNGREIVSEYSTLVNPECKIPHYISAMTGITNEMVADSPRFFEIARNLVELTENAVFVAHNVGFDYGFVRSEFHRLGYEFKRDQLCTVRLSRKLIPGHKSYSLGRICEALNIPIQNRHRAMGDAAATALLFNLLLEAETHTNSNLICGHSVIPREIHPGLDPMIFKRLPEEPGIYFFYNQEGDLIYIGKSKNIKSRVLSHFNNFATAKALRMKPQIADIGYETTGNELVALLSESFEIKKHKPLYNRAQRRTMFCYGLYPQLDDKGYQRFFLGKTSELTLPPLVCFSSRTEALKFINSIIEKYGLCQKLSGLYPSIGNCFHYEIGACKGACIGRESADSYNARATKVIMKFQFGYDNLLIIDSGRDREECSAIKIENGKYLGFGYFSREYAKTDTVIIHECIHPYPDNREVQQIIRQYLVNTPVEKVISF